MTIKSLSRKLFSTVSKALVVAGIVLAIAPSKTEAQTTGATMCAGHSGGAAIPLAGSTANIDFASQNWPSNSYSNTYNLPGTPGVQAATTTTITVTNPNPGNFGSIGGQIGETSSFSETGDTAVFMVTDGLAGFTPPGGTLNVDISANPSSFIDMCFYHINWAGGGGDRWSFTATTDLGSTLTNPIFATPVSPDYAFIGTNDVNATQDAGPNGWVGVRFVAPAGEQITALNGVWTENTTSSNSFHGTGFGQIRFDAPATTPIQARDDLYDTAINGTTGATDAFNVLDDNQAFPQDPTNSDDQRDTFNGSPATTTDVTIAPVGAVPSGITLAADGDVSVAPGTAEGVYTFDYEICEVGNATNCSTATVRLTVWTPFEGTGTAVPQTCSATGPAAVVLTSGTAAGSSSAGGSLTDTLQSLTGTFTTTNSGVTGYNTATSTIDAATNGANNGNYVMHDFRPADANPDQFTTTFNVTPSGAGTSSLVRYYGRRGVPGETPGGDNSASNYTFSWTGGGSASFYDSTSENIAMYRSTSTGGLYVPSDFDIGERQIAGQSDSGSLTSGQTLTVYNVVNNASEWYVEFPLDATNITVTKVVLAGSGVTTPPTDPNDPILYTGADWNIELVA